MTSLRRPAHAAAWLLLTSILLLSWAGSATATAPDSSPADSLVVDLPDLVVQAGAAVPPPPDRTRLTPATLDLHGGSSLAELGAILPSVRVAENSRGDRHLMVRGAPERHVQTFLDGIPLNLPWDERVDLATVPAIGLGGIEGRRGLVTLLDGPAALAGSLRLLPPTLRGDRPVTRLSIGGGQSGLGRAQVLRQQRTSDWNLLGATSWLTRDAWPLPAGQTEADGAEDRTNSDLRQYALMLRAARPVGTTGRLSLLATAWTGEKGVPAEQHLGQDARFWRYPVRERALLGAALQLPLDEAGNWDLGATLSADLFHQEIDPRGPDGWDLPLQDGQDYEKNFDRTGYARLRLTRWWGERANLAVQGSARYSHHRESVSVGGGTTAYAQLLTSLVAEGEFQPAAAWTLRAGAGWDLGATPESGDKPGKDADHAVALNLRLTHDLNADWSLFAAASRRSRFPALRELYSGALGRFVLNPDLKPERQDQLETGLTTGGGRWSLTGAAFVSWLHDGIEKERLPGPDRQFQRVNRTRIRVPGVELIASVDLGRQVDLQVQHTILTARVDSGAGYDTPAEDRPDYQSLLAMTWRPAIGPGLLLEADLTGPRWSAEATADSGLSRLPAGVVWHLVLSWRWRVGSVAATEVEAQLRVANLFDQSVSYQTGLPEPGRIVSGGVSLSF